MCLLIGIMHLQPHVRQSFKKVIVGFSDVHSMGSPQLSTKFVALVKELLGMYNNTHSTLRDRLDKFASNSLRTIDAWIDAIKTDVSSVDSVMSNMQELFCVIDLMKSSM